MSSSSSSETILTLSLEKPLGMILEEVEEGQAKGVKVEELSDAGSAYQSEYREEILGCKLASVMGVDVTQLGFDDVMDKIINAPSPVEVGLEISVSVTDDDKDKDESATDYDIGTTVTVIVLQEGKPTITIEDAKVGDNLRKTLLSNNVELYRGLKKKLGNCGGGGQCTFCAIDLMLDSEGTDGWTTTQSEYEQSKIGKFGNTARLACMNNIMGPATIRVE